MKKSVLIFFGFLAMAQGLGCMHSFSVERRLQRPSGLDGGSLPNSNQQSIRVPGLDLSPSVLQRDFSPEMGPSDYSGSTDRSSVDLGQSLEGAVPDRSPESLSEQNDQAPASARSISSSSASSSSLNTSRSVETDSGSEQEFENLAQDLVGNATRPDMEILQEQDEREQRLETQRREQDAIAKLKPALMKRIEKLRAEKQEREKFERTMNAGMRIKKFIVKNRERRLAQLQAQKNAQAEATAEENAKKAAAEALKQRNDAATTIQKPVRVDQAKKKLVELKAEKARLEQEAEEVAAAKKRRAKKAKAEADRLAALETAKTEAEEKAKEQQKTDAPVAVAEQNNAFTKPEEEKIKENNQKNEQIIEEAKKNLKEEVKKVVSGTQEQRTNFFQNILKSIRQILPQQIIQNAQKIAQDVFKALLPQNIIKAIRDLFNSGFDPDPI